MYTDWLIVDYGRFHEPGVLPAQSAAGLAKLSHGLIVADTTLYRRVRELRFWRVGHWTQLWGTSIVMSSDEIMRQRHLVPDILALIRTDAA